MDSVYELICMLISLYNRGFPIILEEQIFCKKELGHIHISNILFLEIHLFDRNMLYFPGSLNIGPKQDILEYCKTEWRGQTKRAAIMQKVRKKQS